MNNLSLITTLPLLAFFILLLLQALSPRRDINKAGVTRMIHNLLLFCFNTAVFRLLIPLTLVFVASWATTNQFGLFHVISIAPGLSILLCVVILDFAVYWQHVATHKLNVLWRFHKVHHADHEMDVTTAVRFHPIELLLSLFYKSSVVLILGAPMLAVILFELLLFIGPTFNHSNVALPNRLDAVLRWFIATPDTHRTHHSIYKDEQDTNYGFFLIWWDRMFGTYTEIPRDGHVAMKIGLPDLPPKETETIDKSLLMPFKLN